MNSKRKTPIVIKTPIAFILLLLCFPIGYLILTIGQQLPTTNISLSIIGFIMIILGTIGPFVFAIFYTIHVFVSLLKNGVAVGEDFQQVSEKKGYQGEHFGENNKSKQSVVEDDAKRTEIFQALQQKYENDPNAKEKYKFVSMALKSRKNSERYCKQKKKQNYDEKIIAEENTFEVGKKRR